MNSLLKELVDIQEATQLAWMEIQNIINKNMDKYYTPELEEFHIGFEHQVLVDDIDTWVSFKYTEYSSVNEIIRGGWSGDKGWTLLEKLKENKVRVKYLDKEDIESLGFRFGEVSKKEVNGEIIDLSTKGSKYIIHAVGEYNRDKLFEGTIKNKSELQRLMKQLGI
jgi:hypothetical protein